MMRRVLFLLSTLLLVVSCENVFNHRDIWDKINDHEARIARLEIECYRMNVNISSIQEILESVYDYAHITNISSVVEDGVSVGYVFTLSTGESLTVYHGINGKDGEDGADGEDGYSPVIGVKKDVDGVYYWTLDGEWLLGEEDDKLPVSGKNGAPGEDGADGSGGVGRDGITPQLKIEDGFWYVSYDDGVNWKQLGQATGDQGPQGPQGKPGVGGDSMFTDIDFSSSEEYVILYLNNGEEIKLPTWVAFETLKQQCDVMNKNIEGIQKILEELEEKNYIVSVNPVYDGTAEVGYVIKFSKGESVTIFHGKDGENGEDGHSPAIGVAKDADGRYYWTLDGEWLCDAHGNKIPTTGENGASGGDSGEGGVSEGTGKDGVTPQLKIEDGYWFVSYDEGGSWIKLGKATGDAGNGGDSFFRDVKDGDKYLTLVLSDGTEIYVPKAQGDAVEILLSKVSGNAAIFNGTVNRNSRDLKVAVYYATYGNLTVYKYTGKTERTEFPGNAFELRVNGLAENTRYYYFTEITSNGIKTYSEVTSFTTGDSDAYIDWEEGEKIEGNI